MGETLCLLSLYGSGAGCLSSPPPRALCLATWASHPVEILSQYSL